MRKSNTVQNLFSQLQKILEIMSEKELTTFQEQLYRNLLNSAFDARKLKTHISYNTLDTTPQPNILYFIDYDEDAVIPRSGSANLVNIYSKIMNKKGKSISIYLTKDELMGSVADFAHQARDGADAYEHLNDDQMLKIINED